MEDIKVNAIKIIFFGVEPETVKAICHALASYVSEIKDGVEIEEVSGFTTRPKITVEAQTDMSLGLSILTHICTLMEKHSKLKCKDFAVQCNYEHEKPAKMSDIVEK